MRSRLMVYRVCLAAAVLGFALVAWGVGSGVWRGRGLAWAASGAVGLLAGALVIAAFWRAVTRRADPDLRLLAGGALLMIVRILMDAAVS